jgi:hypothetical protein
MKLSNIWSDFSILFQYASNTDKARLMQIVDRSTGELTVTPEEFCEELLEQYCSANSFRMLFDYSTLEENAILLNYPDNREAFIGKLVRDLVGQQFNGDGAVFTPVVEWPGYILVDTAWPFKFFVFEDHDGDNDQDIATPLLDEVISTASNGYIQEKEIFFAYKKALFYKNSGDAAFLMDDDDEADVSMQSIDAMQDYIDAVFLPLNEAATEPCDIEPHRNKDFVKAIRDLLTKLGMKDLEFDSDAVYFHNPEHPTTGALAHRQAEKIYKAIADAGYDEDAFTVKASVIIYPKSI